MGRRTRVALATLFALAVAAPAANAAREPLNAYRVAPTAENKSALALAGFDMTEADHGRYLEIYGTSDQIADLKRTEGIGARLVGNERAAAAQATALPPTGSDAAYNVWRRYDRVPSDDKEQYLELYDRLEGKNIVKKVPLGTTHLGRQIVALKVTKNAKQRSDNTRPAVLYNALQHAREWLAGETCKRTLLYFTENYGKDTEAGEIVTPLVDSRELWFLCVANPDGYEYTFTEGNRLWRKNMADNDGDGVHGEVGDGVDPNRNFATNWGRDNEGSSDDPTSETYRGTGPDSEPETKAMKKLWSMVDFTFQKNDHTAAELLLYPQGFQQYTPTPDNAIFEALAGNDADSAIADKEWNADEETWEITGNRFDPDISAELYITNGDTLDDAYAAHDILGFTPEGSVSDLPNESDFIYQDVEADVESEFQRHRLFALDLAISADDPGNPVSHLGNTVNDFYVDTFADSYGDPQPVQVTAKRSLGEVKLRYRINDGNVHTAGTEPFEGGERYYQEDGTYYERLRGMVTGTEPGDEVEVWFTGGRKSSSHFTYTARAETDADVLILSAENYTAGVPAQDPSGPHYLTYYTDALDELGVDYDIYDVDKRGNRSPDALGVLGHYDTVIWYMGDDYLARQPGQMAGTGTARLAVEEMIDVRDFLNEGGRLFYTGKNAGLQYAEGNEFRNFGFPEGWEGGEYCNKNGTQLDPPAPEFDPDDPSVADGCIAHNDDFLQYYLGAYTYASPGNTFDDAEGHPHPLMGSDGGPFEDLSWSFDETGANNQDHSATFVVTSSILDPERYPLYADSRSVADWLRPGAAPFSPFSGEQYMAAGAHSGAYKRLGKTLDLTGATAPQVNFKFSADVESQWDWVVVEARDVTTDPNSDAWTTLPEQDTDGAGPDSSLTALAEGELPGGDSCPEGLAVGSDALHPFLQHYLSDPPECAPTGDTGEWHRFTGSSGGWTDWTVDLSAYAGKQVDLRISVITDWGTLGLGAWIDDWRLTDGAETLEFNDFEQPLDASWQIGPPPEGTDNPANGWTQRGQEFLEGGVVVTDDTVYTGFGFEGINETARTEFLRRTLDHLGVGSTSPTPGNGNGNGAGNGGGQAGGGQVLAASKKGRAFAKLKSGRKLRVDRKGRVKVRVRGEGDDGAVVSGKVRLVRGKTQYGAKRFSVRAGQTKTVAVKLRKSVRKALRRGKALRATLTAKGTDSSGASIAARQTVRLTR